MGREFSTASSLRPPMSTDHTFPLPCSACQCPLSPICFQQLPTIKSHNPFVLITIQNTPRVWGPPAVKTLQELASPKAVTRCLMPMRLLPHPMRKLKLPMGLGESNCNNPVFIGAWGEDQ